MIALSASRRRRFHSFRWLSAHWTAPVFVARQGHDRGAPVSEPSRRGGSRGIRRGLYWRGGRGEAACRRRGQIRGSPRSVFAAFVAASDWVILPSWETASTCPGRKRWQPGLMLGANSAVLASKDSALSTDTSPAVGGLLPIGSSRGCCMRSTADSTREPYLSTSEASFEDCSFLRCPPYEPKLLEDDEHSLVFLNRAGIKEKLPRSSRSVCRCD